MATASTLADEHQQGQEALVSLIPAVIEQAWPLLDFHNLNATLPQFVAAVQAIVARYGQASAAASLAYYQQARALADAPGRPTLPMAPAPQQDVVESAVRYAVSDLYGPVTADSVQTAKDRLDEAASRLVLNQGRDTIIAATQKDKAARGWARVTEQGACSFCTMLALRAGAGLLYTSKRGADFKAHDHCRCHVEPVFGQYEPPARLREAAALWASSTKGRSGHDARVAFRQAIEGRPVKGTTGANPARAAEAAKYERLAKYAASQRQRDRFLRMAAEARAAT